MKDLTNLQKKILKKLETYTQIETLIDLKLTHADFRKNLNILREKGYYKSKRNYRPYPMMIQQHYNVPDVNLIKAKNIILTNEQKIYLEKNKRKKRTELAKELGISKMALLFLLDNELDKS